MKILINRIMINGRSLSGKDTIGDYLIKKYGFNRIFFAEGIYEIAYKYFGMTNKSRVLLQAIGEKMREIDKDVWVNYTYNQINNYINYCATDIRRENEYIEGLKYGFLPIRISADFDLRVQRAIKRDGFYPDISLWENESEIGADPFDYIEVINNGTFNELYQQIDDIMNQDHTEFIKYIQEKYTKGNINGGEYYAK